MCGISEIGAVLDLLYLQRAASVSPSSSARRGDSKDEVRIRRLLVRNVKVLHLNNHASGGSYEYAALLSTALVALGIESRVLCKNSASPQTGKVVLDRVVRRAYVSSSTEPWHGTVRLLWPPASEELKGVDVVHLHTVADWFDIPKWLEALPLTISVVISIHDMWHVTGGCFVFRGCDRYARQIQPCNPCPILKWPANRFLAKSAHSRKLRAYQNCGTCMVANSNWLAEIAAVSPIAKACGGVEVIPPGIDTTVFRPRDKASCRKHLDLPEDAFVIVTGGASLTDENKNVPWLLEQLSALPDLDGVIILAFGEGAVPVPQDLNVRFTGGIRERHDLAQLLAAADVFVSASLMETYGLALVEAMACGTPVVAFRVGGIPEAAPDGQVAILCPPQDGAALIEAVNKLRNSPQLRQRLGNLAHKTAHTRNAASSFANAFAQLYRDCVSSRENARRKQPVLT
jgi:glycosyltransferase involved in cell wall biosynthesis